MLPSTLPLSPCQGLRSIELTLDDEPMLQRFFDANPEYFLAVQGEPAGLGEAHDVIHGALPLGWSFSKKWLIGYVDTQNNLVAFADVVSDLLAPGVSHIGLFMIASSRHGSGDAQLLYRGLENWAREQGAQWMRLGVVQGNGRVERFWEALGYRPTRTRDGVVMGKRVNTIRVMFKPLAGGTLEQYLSLVERDRPGMTPTK